MTKAIALALSVALLGAACGKVSQKQTDAGAACETPVDCDDQVACTADDCDDGTCSNLADDQLCESGETCDPTLGCEPLEAVCDTGERCVEPAPSGWEGPALQRAGTGSETAGCPAAASEELVAGHVDLAASEAECDCTCNPMNATCTDTSAADYGDTACNQVLGGGPLGTACSSLGGGAPAYVISTPTVDSGSCQESEENTIAPPERTEARALCTPQEDAPACSDDSGVCLAGTGEDDLYCVSMAGDVQCPSGSAYQEREVIFTAVDDTRSCTACECGTIEGTCSATAELFSGPCDATPNQTVPANGVCQVQTSYDNGRLVINAVSASCPATPGSPEGEVKKTGLVTLCCATF